MRSLKFAQVDVFSAEPFMGNPVAVVAGADELDDSTMAAIARWTNLSETTFLLQPRDPAADYRLRIFTSAGELPFAGHPTLGSCRAWQSMGGRPRDAAAIVQECGVGLVTIRGDGPRLAFAAPPLLRSGPVDPATLESVCGALGLPPARVQAAEWVDNGPGWIGLLLDCAATVSGLQPRFHELTESVGVIGGYPPGAAADVEVRAFCPGLGENEDPVTGSLNAGLAQWLIGAGTLPPRYVAAQGRARGRAGRVHISLDDGQVWVAGDTVPRVVGFLHWRSD